MPLRPQQQPAEQAAEHAADQAGDQRRQQHGGAEVAHVELAEIGVVALQRDRDQARDDDGADEHAAGSALQAAAELLDREHDAGQRRVERRGDAGGAAGEDQVRRTQCAPVRQEAVREVQHRGRDLHRRALAPGREAADQRERSQHDLARRDAQRQQRGHRPAERREAGRRDHLRNAAAGGAGHVPARGPDDQHAECRCEHERRPGPAPVDRVEQRQRLLGERREADHREAGRARRRPQHRAHLPALAQAAVRQERKAGARAHRCRPGGCACKVRSSARLSASGSGCRRGGSRPTRPRRGPPPSGVPRRS